MAKTGRNKEPEAVRCSQHAAPSPVVPFQLRLQTLASIRSGMVTHDSRMLPHQLHHPGFFSVRVGRVSQRVAGPSLRSGKPRCMCR